jgi:signal transduction histidine kinase
VPEPADTSAPAVGSRARILACDDSATMRALIRSILGAEHEVVETATAEAALEEALARPPDLFVCDLLLPGMSGSDLCRRVRLTPGLADIPFVLVTTLADTTSRALGLEAGADDYLYKPLRERELRARVTSLLRLRRTMQALEARSRELLAANAALRETQGALLRAEKLASVGTLAAGLAHEINNPLSTIKAGAAALQHVASDLARLLRESLPSPSAALTEALQDLAELSGELTGGCRRLERIAVDLRNIAAPQAPADELVDPAEVVESAFLMARARFAAMPSLDLEVEPGPPIESVGRLLVQALGAILENAVLASGPGGTVTVRLRQLNVGVEISIQDSGPGIPPELLQRVFDPFFSTRPQGQGSGLGLSLAYGIVHGLGGDVSVESPPGRGATFRLRLPRGPATRAGAPPR